jgi:hypothetical protein
MVHRQGVKERIGLFKTKFIYRVDFKSQPSCFWFWTISSNMKSSNGYHIHQYTAS